MPRGYTHTVMNASRASLVVFRLSAPAAGLLAALAVGMLTSCSTTGSGSAPVTVTQGSAPQQEKPPTQVPTTKQGLEIVSDPDRAEIWVDGDFKGLTPFIVTDVTQGWHQLLLRKAGYREVSTWLQFTSDYMLYQTSLTRITGFLQIDVSPPNAVVTVANSVVSPGLQELPVGSYTVSVRAFGYADFTGHVTITEKTVTPLSVNLLPAPFAVADFSLLRGRVNPDNPVRSRRRGGAVRRDRPGNGEDRGVRPPGNSRLHQGAPGFRDLEPVIYLGRAGQRRPPPCGRRLPGGALRPGERGRIIPAGGRAQGGSDAQDCPDILWSGSAGLLFAPVAEVLPPEEFQASVLGRGICARGGLPGAPVPGDPPGDWQQAGDRRHGRHHSRFHRHPFRRWRRSQVELPFAGGRIRDGSSRGSKGVLPVRLLPDGRERPLDRCLHGLYRPSYRVTGAARPRTGEHPRDHRPDDLSVGAVRVHNARRACVALPQRGRPGGHRQRHHGSLRGPSDAAFFRGLPLSIGTDSRSSSAPRRTGSYRERGSSFPRWLPECLTARQATPSREAAGLGSCIEPYGLMKSKTMRTANSARSVSPAIR